MENNKILNRRSFLKATAGTAAAAGVLASCSPEKTGAKSKVQLDYWLWDANQLLPYSKSIREFERQNPDIEVRITQMGWDSYWQKLTAAFVAESAPDVFCNHLGRYPQLMDLGVLQPLDELEATRDIKNDDYLEGLAQLWIGDDGHRYGVPKDFDTIAYFYNKKVLKESDVKKEDIENSTWNPKDGGSFQEIIAHLTVDKSGKRGNENGFNAKAIETFGLGGGKTLNYQGQSEWSSYAFTMPWYFTDKPTWGTHFNYDKPGFQDTIAWMTRLANEHHFMPGYGEFGDSLGGGVQLGSNKSVLFMTGSWMIGTFAGLDGVEIGMASTPSGPVGHPMSMFNGLGDSISKQSTHKEEAARLVAWLGSEESQLIVGEMGVVFPAREAGMQACIQAYEKRGLDVEAFIKPVKEKHTALFPLVRNAAQIESLMQPVLDEVFMGSKPVDALTAVNEKINALFK